MADETKIEAKAAAEAPAKVAETVAATVEKVADEATKTAKRTRAATARRAKRQAAAKAPTARKTSRRAKTVRRNTRAGARKAAAATIQGIETVKKNSNNYFAAFEGFAPTAQFQNLFADANERGQQAVRRSQQVAEEVADLTRANVEAFVEAGRVAAEGARSLGQDAVARGREGVEQAADAIRSLAEAKSPTEFIQLQSEFARSSFDRIVAETSRLTESMVKLAGEAIQPLSNRATANAERINTFVA